MDLLKKLKKEQAYVRDNFGVNKLGIFGSYARGEGGELSDIDILVEFKSGFKTFDNFMDLKFFLENLFNRKIDLVTLNALKPQLKENILNEVNYA